MNTWLACARLRVALAIAMTASLAAIAPASAGELDYRVGLGMGYSDNVGRRPDALKEDESIATAGLRFAYDENTRRLNADVTGDVTYLDYLDNTYDAELVGNFFANTAFALIPERLTWNVSDQWGQVAIDPFTPATPDNRENINYFSTGPDAVIGLGSQYRLGLGANYSLVDYEDEPLDSAITGGRLALIRLLSDRSSLSLNAGARSIEYDEEALDSDYRQTEAFVEYRANGARTNLLVNAGWSEVDREAESDAESGALLRVNVSRRVSPSSIITLTGGREFTTSAGSFAADQGAGVSPAPTQQTADPFNNDRVQLSWDFFRHVTALSLSTAWSKQTHEAAPELDTRMLSMAARYRRDLSPTLSLNITGTYFKSEFQIAERDFDTSGMGLSLSWRMSRYLTLLAKYDFEKRDAELLANQYTENRFLLSLEYGRGEPRSTRNPPRFGVDAASSTVN